MDGLSDKVWAVIAGIISLLGGVYMYDRESTNKRLTKIEEDVNQHKCDIAVVKSQFEELKSDTQEIKDAQNKMLELLTKRRR